MADQDPTIPLNIEALNFIGAQCFERADKLTSAATDLLTVIAGDLKLAARICDRLADLRFAVAEIAAKIENTNPAAARDLRAALETAAAEV